MSEKVKKILFWCILIAGAVVLGICKTTQGWDNTFARNVIAAWVILGAVFYFGMNTIPFLRVGKKLDKLTYLLTEQLDPDSYIREVNALFEHIGSEQLQQIKLINLSAAYCDKRDYKKSKELLDQVKLAKLSLANRAIYWANLALTSFYLGEGDKACEIMDKQQQAFQTQMDYKRMEPTFAILTVFYQLYKGNKQEAKKVYASARKKWNSGRYEADFAYLEPRVLGNKKLKHK